MIRSVLGKATPSLIALAAIVGLIGIAVSATAAPSDTLIVDDDAAECPDAGYVKIQPALDAAAENATVHVCAGTYHESLNMTTPGVSLVASEAGEVLLDGETTLKSGVWMQANGTTVKGFHVQDYTVVGILADRTDRIADGKSGFVFGNDYHHPTPNHRPANIEIAENTISFRNLTPPCEPGECADHGAKGIWVHESANATIRDNAVSTPPQRWRGEGIILVNAIDSEVVSNHVTLANLETTGGIHWAMGLAGDVYLSDAAGSRQQLQDCPMSPETSEHPTCLETATLQQARDGVRQACSASDSSDLAWAPTPGGEPAVPGPGSDSGERARELACPVLERTRNATVGSPVDRSLGRWTNNTVADNVIRVEDSQRTSLLHLGLTAIWQRGTTILNNTIDRVDSGLSVRLSNSMEIRENRINNTVSGLTVHYFSRNVTLRGNSVTDSVLAFRTNIDTLPGPYGHDIDRSNTVDGDPIVYLEDVQDRVIDPDGDLGAVHIVNSENVTVRDVHSIERVWSGVKIINSTDVTVENVTIRDPFWGIKTFASSDVNILENTVTTGRTANSQQGIQVALGSRSVTVESNVVTGFPLAGITVLDPGTVVVDNEVHDTAFAIANLASRTLVANNTATDSIYGYYGSSPETPVDPLIRHAFGNSPLEVSPTGRYPEGGLLVGNTFHDNLFGMILTLDKAATLHDNRMHDNEYNFWARNAHAIDATNTVDGKPILYLVGANGATIDGRVPGVDPGYVGVVDSHGVTLQHLELSNNGQGVMVDESIGVQVRDSTFSDVENGVSVFESRGILIEDVTVENADYTGIGLWNDVQAATVRNASVHAEDLGLVARDSEGVVVRDSTLDVEGEPFALSNVLLLGSTNATVEDISLTGSGRVAGVLDFVTSGSRIADNRMADVPVGVLSDGTFQSTITDNVIDNATFGVYSAYSDGTSISDNEVPRASFGLLSFNNQATTIRSNTVKGGLQGVTTAYTVDDRVVDNEIRDARLGVVSVIDTPGLLVENNVIAENGNGTWIDSGTPKRSSSPTCVSTFFNIEHCEQLDPPEPTAIRVLNNSIQDNANRGVFVGPNATADLTENRLAIHNNTIADNGGLGIDARDAAYVVDARNNYWGASDGPSSLDTSNPLEDPFTGVLADGTGDAVSENASNPGVSNVRFDAWLTEAPDTSAEEEQGPLAGLEAPASSGQSPQTAAQTPVDLAEWPPSMEAPVGQRSWCVAGEACPSLFGEEASSMTQIDRLMAELMPTIER